MQTQYLFFSGKGGVGKTTMACATAVQEADAGRKTLIVTTDPASNLADTFEQPIGHQVVPITGVPNLFAMEIDPDRATEEYRDRILGPFRAVMPEDVTKVLEEQFRSPCTTEIASFDRFVDFMDDEDAYDTVIFDTAPTGHTIRLLELPVDWSQFISDSTKGAGQTCMGPVQAIQDSKEKYDRAIRLLNDPSRTRFIFVLQPEQTAIFETERSSNELRSIGVNSQEMIVNGILPAEVCDEPLFRSRYDMQQRHLTEIASRFPVPTRRIYLRDKEVKGIASLRQMAKSLSGQDTHEAGPTFLAGSIGQANLHSLSAQDLQRLFTPANGAGKMIFFTGKGGVGKTSMSCVAATHLAQLGFKTLLLTTDPAAHLGQVLDVPVGDHPAAIASMPNLWASRIDPKKATEEYKAKVIEDARKRYSPDMLAAMREELDSPCTEEMATFDKFTEYANSTDFDVIVFDTAPTGHTLRLLELPFDYSDQVEMMVATTKESGDIRAQTRARFEHIIARLKDPEQSVFVSVVYPESTPIVEAYRAMLDLKATGIPTQLVVANQVIPANLSSNAFFANRRAMQIKYLNEIQGQFGTPVLIMPLLDKEIRGVEVLNHAAHLLFAPDSKEAASGELISAGGARG
jgi:arsenite-transporting ATPase